MSTKQPVGIKETLTSLVIAFVMAFVFRGFVVEGFIIPTGSMAPTLLGKHVRFVSPYNGYDWTTNPWDYAPGNVPLSVQGAAGQPPLTPSDPITGLPIEPQRNRRLAAGDRVFVLKYLPGLHRPDRWDVVVFKYPGTHENYIKRLIGLPGEQIALVDGDVFHRDYDPGATSTAGPHAWREPGWSIARKSERTQRTMFQPVFDSRYTPVRPERSYRLPVSPTDPGRWTGLQEGPVWSYTGADATTLSWNNRRPITDYYAYNQPSNRRNPSTGVPPADPFVRPEDTGAHAVMPPYPVSDLALSITVEPTESPVAVTPTITAREHEFQAVVDPAQGRATVRMRPEGGGAWTDLDAGGFSGLRPGEPTKIEFWHVDQALWLFVDGRLVAGGPERGAYELTPAQRIAHAMLADYDELIAKDQERATETYRPGVDGAGVFARPEMYRQPTVRWDFAGGPFTVHRLRVDRDIFYQPAPARYGNQPTLGAHYDNFPTLTPDQFFMLGDNSPASLDSRLWSRESIDPWVRERIDDTPGAVHRDLIVGKAFIVYFPAPLDGGPILAPDLGRVRWIW